MANLACHARSCMFRIPLRVSPLVAVTCLPHSAPASGRGDLPRVADSWLANQVRQQAQGRGHA